MNSHYLHSLFCVIIVSSLIGETYAKKEDSNVSVMFIKHNLNENYSPKFETMSGICYCNGHGICDFGGKICVCDKEYATYNYNINDQCNYKRKHLSTAIILQIVPVVSWLGSADFYIDHNVTGTLKLLIFFFAVIIHSLLRCLDKLCWKNWLARNGIPTDNNDVIPYSPAIFFWLILMAWYLVDIALYTAKYYRMDGHNIGLYDNI